MSEGVSQESPFSIEDLFNQRVAEQASADEYVARHKAELVEMKREHLRQETEKEAIIAAGEKQAAKKAKSVAKLAPIHQGVIEQQRAIAEAQRKLAEMQRMLVEAAASDDDDDDDDDDAVAPVAQAAVQQPEPVVVPPIVTAPAVPEPPVVTAPVVVAPVVTAPVVTSPLAPVVSARAQVPPAPPSKPVSARPGKSPAPAPSASTRQAPSQAPSARAGKGELSKLTFPERVAEAMGDGVHDAGEIEKIMDKSGTRSTNLRSYISNVLSGAKARVPGPDGKDLKKADGKPVEVKMFVKVDHGKYRVATKDEIQREARKELGSDEAIISKTPRTPADVMFAEQGIDITPVLNP